MLSDSLQSVTLGDPLDNSENVDGYQVAIPKGTVFNAEIIKNESYSLVTCLVAPGKLFKPKYITIQQNSLITDSLK